MIACETISGKPGLWTLLALVRHGANVKGSAKLPNAVYEAGVPAHCPPTEAVEKDATLYRVCAHNPAHPDDYASHLNSKHKSKRDIAARKLRINPLDCTPSGLSVWLTEKDMRHACAAFAFTEGKYVFTTDVKSNEGRLQPTGKDEHHTYWPYASTDLVARASLAFGPVNRSTADVG